MKPRLDFSKVDPLARLRPGRASDYIRSFDELAEGDSVILCCRVSGRVQRWNKNLQERSMYLRMKVEERGGIVVRVHEYCGSGFDPCWLYGAALTARRHGAILLAESTDRFIRHPEYHSEDNPDAQARDLDLKYMVSFTCEVPLMTYLDPDASPEEVRSQDRKRGQEMKNNKGGRPQKRARYIKPRRNDLLHEVKRLKQGGYTQVEISTELDIPQPTISRWLQK